MNTSVGTDSQRFLPGSSTNPISISLPIPVASISTRNTTQPVRMIAPVAPKPITDVEAWLLSSDEEGDGEEVVKTLPVRNDPAKGNGGVAEDLWTARIPFYSGDSNQQRLPPTGPGAQQQRFDDYPNRPLQLSSESSFRCTLCRIAGLTRINFQQHLDGRRHKEALRMQRNGQASIVYNKPPTTSNPFPVSSHHYNLAPSSFHNSSTVVEQPRPSPPIAAASLSPYPYPSYHPPSPSQQSQSISYNSSTQYPLVHSPALVPLPVPVPVSIPASPRPSIAPSAFVPPTVHLNGSASASTSNPVPSYPPPLSSIPDLRHASPLTTTVQHDYTNESASSAPQRSHSIPAWSQLTTPSLPKPPTPPQLHGPLVGLNLNAASFAGPSASTFYHPPPPTPLPLPLPASNSPYSPVQPQLSPLNQYNSLAPSRLNVPHVVAPYSQLYPTPSPSVPLPPVASARPAPPVIRLRDRSSEDPRLVKSGLFINKPKPKGKAVEPARVPKQRVRELQKLDIVELGKGTNRDGAGLKRKKIVSVASEPFQTEEYRKRQEEMEREEQELQRGMEMEKDMEMSSGEEDNRGGEDHSSKRHRVSTDAAHSPLAASSSSSSASPAPPARMSKRTQPPPTRSILTRSVQPAKIKRIKVFRPSSSPESPAPASPPATKVTKIPRAKRVSGKERRMMPSAETEDSDTPMSKQSRVVMSPQISVTTGTATTRSAVLEFDDGFADDEEPVVEELRKDENAGMMSVPRVTHMDVPRALYVTEAGRNSDGSDEFAD